VISAAASGLPDVARLIYLAAFLTEPDTDTVALVTEQLPTDHSPFLTRPAAVAELAAGYLA
jgi:hypothetical protein